jgi:DNA-nicking Smr family endonuclease
MNLLNLLKKLWHESNSDILPTLDLHGLSVKEAIEEVRAFLSVSFHSGRPAVRIIYGKGLGSPGGRGVLREIIPRWCTKEGSIWVEGFQREIDEKGGDGSLIVFLKKPQSP